MALLIIGICVGIALMVTLPLYFTRKNEAAAAKEEFEEYIDKLRACDHKYSPLSRQLSNNLNTINFWLKTGRNPADDDEDSKIAENAHRFYSGQMDRVEARRWANAVKEAQNSEAAVKEAKAKRNKEFTLTGLKGMDFGQSEMTFYYDRTYSDQIYYCVSNDALENQMYKMVIYFTTARSSNIPQVYPNKYEGAQMLSIYKHPSQAAWFLNNWKAIRDGLEGKIEEDTQIGEALAEFNL